MDTVIKILEHYIPRKKLLDVGRNRILVTWVADKTRDFENAFIPLNNETRQREPIICSTVFQFPTVNLKLN